MTKRGGGSGPSGPQDTEGAGALRHSSQSSSVEIDRSCQAWCGNGPTYDTKQEVSEGNLF